MKGAIACARRETGAQAKYQRACKPGSVHPLRDWATIPLGTPLPTCSSNQPGRRAGTRACAAPIRSCSRWGLPCRPRHRARGALLPHPFTVASPKRSPSALCGTFPRVAPGGRYPPPSFRGARTFLDMTSMTRPPGPLVAAPVAAAGGNGKPQRKGPRGSLHAGLLDDEAAPVRARPRKHRSSLPVE